MEHETKIADRSFAPLWWLRGIILLQGIGVGGRYLVSSNEVESDVYGLLYFDWSWSELLAQRIDDVGAGTCLVAGLVVVTLGFADLFVKSGGHRSLLKMLLIAGQVVAAMGIATWSLALSVTFMIRGDMYCELSLGEHAVRYVVPVAFALLLSRKRRLQTFAIAFLVGACAVTFAVHGYKAMRLYGPFTDLILLTDQRLFGFGIEQATAERMLVTIGAIDIVLAIVFIANSISGATWRWLTIYLILWGVITAFSRMTAYGWNAWPETLIRTANGGAPLAYLLWCRYKLSTSQFAHVKLQE